MPAARYLLFLARLEPDRKRKLGVIATADELELVTIEEAGGALTWLERHEPRIVVFDPSIPKVEKVCAKLRSKKTLAGVPLIALSPELDDPFVAKLYGMGADDVLPSAAWASLVARIRAVPIAESLRPPPARGRAIIADADHGRCDVIGRVLGNAGYDVRLALDERALEYYSQQKDIVLVVANAELGAPAELARASRKLPNPPVWIVTAQRRELAELTDALNGLPKVAVMGTHAPPENILFTANELAGEHRDSGRRTDRVLHGTLVNFRAAGADEDDIGFVYNISRDGLYVRTLAPPEAEVIWLDCRPPRSKLQVRLEARVVWRQRFGPGIAVSGPAGFGVEITDGLGDGLSQWHEAYDAFSDSAARGGLRVSRPDMGTAPAAGSRNSAPIVEFTGGNYPALSPEPAVKPPPPPPPEPVAPVSLDFELEPASAQPPPPPPARAVEPQSVPVPSVPPPVAPSRVPWLPLLGLVVAGVLAGVAFLAWPRPKSVAPAPPALASAPPVTSAPPAVQSAAASAPAPPASVAVAAPSASAAPAASVAPPGPPPVDMSGGDGSDLLTTEGYLVVHSAADGVVYLSGFPAGPTNKKLKTHCGLRFARVGVVPMGQWLSEGKTVDIKCQKITEATLEPPK